MNRLLIVLTIALFGSLVSELVLAATKHTPPQPIPLLTAKDCRDFLALTGKKPANVTYEKCVFAPDRQGKPLVATYSVKGLHAVAVEAWLVKNAGLVKLKRSCCQWDGPAGGFTDKAGRRYQITMVSDENTVSTRKNWRNIQQFEITVESFTEEI
jgi:Domian of unknown function (DUF4952)